MTSPLVGTASIDGQLAAPSDRLEAIGSCPVSRGFSADVIRLLLAATNSRIRIPHTSPGGTVGAIGAIEGKLIPYIVM